jgi:hypothetical protein
MIQEFFTFENNCRSSDDETFEFEETLDDAEIGQAKLWLGKDYSNCIVKDFVDLDSPFAGIIFNFDSIYFV